MQCVPFRAPHSCPFNNPPSTDTYTLSLHDALPIWRDRPALRHDAATRGNLRRPGAGRCAQARGARSEEHTSELQSLRHIVCRLLLEKKKHYKDSGTQDVEGDIVI